MPKDIRILPNGKESMESFEQLFRKYYAPLVVYATRYVSGTEIAREIVQDFFVKLYEKRNTLSIDVSVKSYLYRSVYNCCINYLNQRNIQDKHLKNIEQERIDEDNLENEINSVELQYKISEVIEQLPAKCKRIFKMNRLEGFKNDEIAARLNLSKRTVETQISKALKILRKKLSDYIPLDRHPDEI
ncbi:MAG TPA: RNA polymerase sigma-70 factor [Bacteroidales bacterium]|nr:RNA polymerase sigma-70 factor [Bacteroidales bacterium]